MPPRPSPRRLGSQASLFPPHRVRPTRIAGSPCDETTTIPSVGERLVDLPPDLFALVVPHVRGKQQIMRNFRRPLQDDDAVANVERLIDRMRDEDRGLAVVP